MSDDDPVIEDCMHGLDPDFCSICLRRARPVVVEPEPSAHDFKAQYPGRCSGCGLDIFNGQVIHRTGPNRFAHKGC